MSPATDSIRFKDVSVTRNGVEILNNVTAHVPRGSSTAIVGPNGAGKTTLLLALLRQIPFQGQIITDGFMPRIGFVPQKLYFDRSMPLTVQEFLAMSQQCRPLWLGVGNRLKQEIPRLLDSVRAAHLETRMLGMLSGGEMQRVLLALALQREPELLVLDEPAAGVDIHGEQVFCEILEELRKANGFTQLMVSHDLATVTHHADHVIGLNRSVIAEGSPREIFTPETLTALFGLHMNLVDARAMPDGRTDCSAPCCSGDDHAGH